MKAKSAGILALLLVITVGLCMLSYFGIDVKDKNAANAVIDTQDSNEIDMGDLDISVGASDEEGQPATGGENDGEANDGASADAVDAVLDTSNEENPDEAIDAVLDAPNEENPDEAGEEVLTASDAETLTENNADVYENSDASTEIADVVQSDDTVAENPEGLEISTEAGETPVSVKNLFGVKNIKQGLDLSGGVYIVYEADKENPSVDEMNSAVSLIRGRLDRRGYTEAEAFKEGNKRIRVEIPGVEDAETAINEIGRTAQLFFMDEENVELYFSGGESVPAVTGDQIANANKSMITSNGISKIVVNLEFTGAGKAAFAEATKNNIGKPLYIVLDDAVISAPTVNAEITDGNAYIEGGFDVDTAEELAALIRAGSLPFNLNVLEMNKIGARLGANSLETSVFAGIVGFIGVLLFMVIFYRVSGFAASWALVIYTALDLIVLSVIGVTLTLPGIAGIILSIGMAVDANVIIFERMKEELNDGKAMRTAIGNGFSRALPAILDSNVTTIIAGLVLLWLGTGPIKGFAQTLIIGIVMSMFTALFVTRLIITHLVGVGINSTKLYGQVKSKEEL